MTLMLMLVQWPRSVVVTGVWKWRSQQGTSWVAAIPFLLYITNRKCFINYCTIIKYCINLNGRLLSFSGFFARVSAVVHAVLQKLCSLLSFFKDLLSIERLSDSCILQLVKTSFTTFLVDNIQLLQLKAINLICGVLHLLFCLFVVGKCQLFCSYSLFLVLDDRYLLHMHSIRTFWLMKHFSYSGNYQFQSELSDLTIYLKKSRGRFRW